MTSSQLVAVGLVCLALGQPAALAQGTLLSGSVENHNALPKLIRQEPKYDFDDPDVKRPVQKVYATKTVYKPIIQRVYVQDNRTYWQKHPKVRATALGAGVGTAAGAVTGLVSGRGVVRGGLIGAGTGAGVGLVRSSETMKRHPIVRDVASGTLVGLGLSAAATRGKKRLWQGTGVGAAVGLGYGLLKNGLR
ncbi:MAG: hypothetical protein K2Y32_08050 [Candidatus Obscuribacterales bacterium]|nr:hypothetical protein [Candidatus Obscuribacterales bacterium]